MGSSGCHSYCDRQVLNLGEKVQRMASIFLSTLLNILIRQALKRIVTHRFLNGGATVLQIRVTLTVLRSRLAQPSLPQLTGPSQADNGVDFCATYGYTSTTERVTILVTLTF